MGDNKHANEVLAKVHEWRKDGHVADQWAYMSQVDPGYVEAANQLNKFLTTRPDSNLTDKTRETIKVVLLASRLCDRVSAHLDRAMDAGATEAELLEALEVARQITGAPTLLFGADALQQVAEKRKASADKE